MEPKNYVLHSPPQPTSISICSSVIKSQQIAPQIKTNALELVSVNPTLDICVQPILLHDPHSVESLFLILTLLIVTP